MASKQRARAPKKARTSNQLVDLGIFEIPNVDDIDMENDSDGGDSDLESELEAILSGKAGSKPTQPRRKKNVAAPLDIDKLAAGCENIFPEENSEDDDVDLNDPELLKELKSLSFDDPEEPEQELSKSGHSPSIEHETNVPASEPSQKLDENSIFVIQERLLSYNLALTAAKALGDNSKVRRYGRAIKNLEQLLKSAKSGKHVNVDDIPPAVAVPKEKATQPPSEPSHVLVSPLSNDEQAKTSDDKGDKNEKQDKDAILKSRQQKYKIAALQAKRAGDKVTAMEYMKIIKKFDSLIENDDPVDINMVPPSPPPFLNKVPPPDPTGRNKEQGETQTSSALESAALSAASEPEDPSLFAAPPAPNSVLEALEQRLEKFASTKSAAEAEGNSGKARRLQRIVKSYESAIKDYKAGKTVNFEELPVPPGFAPIPVPVSTTSAVSPETPKPSKKPEAVSPQIASNNKQQTTVVSPPKRPAPGVPSRNVQQKSKDQQLEFLLERQRLFREAALQAKKSGQIEQAKEYLRMSKGFDSMIEAKRCGLPIDTKAIPTPPQLAISDFDFEIVERFECADINDLETFDVLHKDLSKQIEIAKNNKEHFLKIGDVAAASKFEKLALESQKDLSVVFHLKKAGHPPPKFHYETRIFSIIKCNSDLSDTELEVTIERGINLPGKPDDLDSYVRIEFPIPNDAVQKAKTNVIRDTNNPIWQEEFKFQFNRKSRAQLRQFKRQFLKLEVFTKGGFFKGDSVLGTVSIKLVDLESTCTIHDSFDVMDGRKMTGGKLECKVRIRQPLLSKQVEQVREKWLVIGS